MWFLGGLVLAALQGAVGVDPSRAGAEFKASCPPEVTLDGRFMLVMPRCNVLGVIDLATLTWTDHATRDRLARDTTRRVWRPPRAPDDAGDLAVHFNTPLEYQQDWTRAWESAVVPRRDLIVRYQIANRNGEVRLTGRLRAGPMALHKADFELDRAASLHGARRWDAAAAAYAEALSHWPSHAAARYNLACVEARRKNVDNAIALLEGLIADYPEVRANLASDSDLKSLAKDPRFIALAQGARGPKISTSTLQAIGLDHTPAPVTTVPATDLREIMRPEGDGFTYDRDELIAAIPDAFALAAHAYLNVREGVSWKPYGVLVNATSNGFFDIVLSARDHVWGWDHERISTFSGSSIDLADLHRRLSAGETIWIDRKPGGAVVLRPR